MGEKSLDWTSVKEYLAIDEASSNRNEYDNGVVVAMTGGTLNHGIIGSNINTAIHNSLSGRQMDCTAINGDVRIFIEQANSFVYPDGMVVCGTIETFESDPHSVVNPLLVVEVLSKSTESYDRGDKFHKYCSLASFQEYVLISQYKPIVDTLYRSEKGVWQMITTIGLEKSIYLNTIEVFIKMEDIYRKTIGLTSPTFRLDS